MGIIGRLFGTQKCDPADILNFDWSDMPSEAMSDNMIHGAIRLMKANDFEGAFSNLSIRLSSCDKKVGSFATFKLFEDAKRRAKSGDVSTAISGFAADIAPFRAPLYVKALLVESVRGLLQAKRSSNKR